MINKKTSVLETYSLILIDIFAVIISFIVAINIRFANFTEHKNFTDRAYLVCILVILASVLYGVFSEFNRDFFARGYFIELMAIAKYEVAMMLTFGLIVFLVQAKEFSRLVFVYFGIIDYFVTYIFHTLFKKVVLNTVGKLGISEKTLIVTESCYAEELLEEVTKSKDWNSEIVAVALTDREYKPQDEMIISDIPVVAGAKDLIDTATLMALDAVFIHVPYGDLKVIKAYIEQFEMMGITCHYNVEKKELNLEGKTAGHFAGFTVMTFSLNYRDYRRVLIKKIMDIIGSIVGLLITALVTPFLALAIKIESPGPVFFAQERVGKNGRRFKIYKFRSMYRDAEERKAQLLAKNEVTGLMFKMEDDPRVTKVGKFIRKTSLDELPQFYNVLKGEMSLVGTRPPTIDEFEKYSAYYRRRLSITPGLTGMWQVSGRSNIDDFDEVVKLDIEYIENWSISLDCKIILQTIGVVLFGKGAK